MFNLIAGIVEFLEPAEARAGFKKLAYTKFGDMPLYLEWAPVDTFTTAAKKHRKAQEEASDQNQKENTQSVEKEESSEAQSDILPPTQVEEEEVMDEDMVPEPDTTLFVKNINFSTEEPAMKKV